MAPMVQISGVVCYSFVFIIFIPLSITPSVLKLHVFHRRTFWEESLGGNALRQLLIHGLTTTKDIMYDIH